MKNNNKLNRTWLYLVVSVLLLIPLTLSACAGSDSTAEDSATGTITTSGSTTVQPLAEKLAEAFSEYNPEINVIVQGGGSSVGIKAAIDQTSDIGMASRELKESEKPGLVETVIARDGIAIVCNPTQTVTDLSAEQIRMIFAGEITNWNQVGGADETITVVSREEGSGTRGAFEELIMDDSLITGGAILLPSNGSIRTTVSSDPNAIGFLSIGYVNSSIGVISVNGVQGSEENVKNGTYEIVRPLLFVTNGEPSGPVKEFIDFCLSTEGQSIVSQDYISVE